MSFGDMLKRRAIRQERCCWHISPLELRALEFRFISADRMTELTRRYLLWPHPGNQGWRTAWATA